MLRGRTSEEGPSSDPFEWTELATITGYAQAAHGLDGADVIFDFEADRIVFQSATVEPFTTISATEPSVRYLMLDGQTSALGLFSIWDMQVNAVSANPAPALAVRRDGSSLTISWPANISGYVLESTAALPSASWALVAGVQNNSVTVTPTATSFYRLRRSN
jgi:hypothetical protein